MQLKRQSEATNKNYVITVKGASVAVTARVSTAGFVDSSSSLMFIFHFERPLPERILIETHLNRHRKPYTLCQIDSSSPSKSGEALPDALLLLLLSIFLSSKAVLPYQASDFAEMDYRDPLPSPNLRSA